MAHLSGARDRDQVGLSPGVRASIHSLNQKELKCSSENACDSHSSQRETLSEVFKHADSPKKNTSKKCQETILHICVTDLFQCCAVSSEERTGRPCQQHTFIAWTHFTSVVTIKQLFVDSELCRLLLTGPLTIPNICDDLVTVC